MKTMILQFMFFCLLFSCSNLNRDKPVDNADLTGDDYRLFQGTPAWELAKAVQDGNEKKISEIVSKDPKLINYQEPKYGNSLLILCVGNQQFKSLKILLEHKADVGLHNTYDGTSALIEACSFKQYNIKFAEILLQNGANVNDIEIGERRQGNSTRFTPLIAAAFAGSLDHVKLLVSKGAEINFQNDFFQSALSESIMVHRYDVSYFLLQNGADFKRPIFYRPDYSIPLEKQDPNDKGKPIYLADILKKSVPDFGTKNYKYKKRIIEFLESKGVKY